LNVFLQRSVREEPNWRGRTRAALAQTWPCVADELVQISCEGDEPSVGCDETGGKVGAAGAGVNEGTHADGAAAQQRAMMLRLNCGGLSRADDCLFGVVVKISGHVIC
jgi:hypothetical protein